MSTQVTLPGRITDQETLIRKTKSNFNDIEHHLGALYDAVENVSSDSTTEIRQRITNSIYIGPDTDKPGL